jgi:hypothetical protein
VQYTPFIEVAVSPTSDTKQSELSRCAGQGASLSRNSARSTSDPYVAVLLPLPHRRRRAHCSMSVVSLASVRPSVRRLTTPDRA